MILIVPGIAAIALGLFIWLGGLGLRKYLLAVAGAVSGALGAFFLVDRNISSAAAAAAGAALVVGFGAIIFQRFFVALITLALTVVTAFTILAWPQINAIPLRSVPDRIDTPKLSIAESADVMKIYAVQLGERAKKIFEELPNYCWIILIMVAVASCGSAFTMRHAASAFACAAFGALLLYAGMMMLLFYKGSAPITTVFQKPPFYGIIFAAMVAFGTMEQLMLFKRKERKLKHPKHQPAAAEHANWRTS